MNESAKDVLVIPVHTNEDGSGIGWFSVGEALSWDEAMDKLADFAEENLPAHINLRYNNFTEKRAMALDIFAQENGLDRMPKLTVNNSWEESLPRGECYIIDFNKKP